ncbi:hypothetical protein HS088_TW17G00149 [Tripterygium wilfordii]|uniref:Uncharacterized protein n=1 Tax=Tripterygium wilfordii TaxID=458696 RepID=A0A7J7CEQ6_TRIWF|nr:hypothetical protein HS088_TW17G00149 [Tripterygium wilfordii]
MSTLSRSASPPRVANLTNLDRLMESVTPFVPAEKPSEESDAESSRESSVGSSDCEALWRGKGVVDGAWFNAKIRYNFAVGVGGKLLVTMHSLPVFGLGSYKLKGSILSSNEADEWQQANSLLQAADNWLQALQPAAVHKKDMLLQAFAVLVRDEKLDEGHKSAYQNKHGFSLIRRRAWGG